MRSRRFWAKRALPLCLLAGSLSWLQAQSSPSVTVTQVGPVSAKRDSTVTVPVQVQINQGFHITSDKPADEFSIPLKLTWDKDSFQTSEVIFPKAEQQKYSFSEKPIAVFTGSFRVESKGKLASNVGPGKALLSGKLRYQACSDTMCFPPKTVPVSVTVDVQ